MKRLFLLLIPVLALMTTACSRVEPYAAVINGHTISASSISDELEAVTSNARYAGLLDQQYSVGSGAGGLQANGKNTINSAYTARVVYEHVLVELIDEEVANKHLQISDADRARAVEAEKANFNDEALYNSLPLSYRTYLVERLAKLNAVMGSRNTPAAQQDYYNKNLNLFETYCVRHILVESQQQANDLYGQIEKGADFAALAKANSTDSGSASSGGDLGCLPGTEVSQFVQPFADAVRDAQPGAVNAPVQTTFGWHLVQVTSKTQQTFAQSQPAISQTLADSQNFFTEALAKAKVKVNPRFGDYVPSDPASNQLGHVVPHPSSAVSAPNDGATSELIAPDASSVQQ